MDSYNWYTSRDQNEGDSSDNNGQEYQWGGPPVERRGRYFGHDESHQENDSNAIENEYYNGSGNYSNSPHQDQGTNTNNGVYTGATWLDEFEDELAQAEFNNPNFPYFDRERDQRGLHGSDNDPSNAENNGSENWTGTGTENNTFDYQHAGEQLDYEEQFGLGTISTQSDNAEASGSANRDSENFHNLGLDDAGIGEVMGRTVSAIENLTRTRVQLQHMHHQLRQGFQRGVNLIQRTLESDHLPIPNQSEELSRHIAMARLGRLVTSELATASNPHQMGIRPLSQESNISDDFDLWDAHSNMTNFTHNHNILNNNESEYESEGEVTPQGPGSQNIRTQQQGSQVHPLPQVINLGFYFGPDTRFGNEASQQFPHFIEHAAGSREYKRQRAIQRGKVPKHFRNVSPGTAEYFKKYGINAGSEADGDARYYDNPYRGIFVLPDPIAAFYPEKDLLGDDTPLSLFDKPRDPIDESDDESTHSEDTLVLEDEENELDLEDEGEELNDTVTDDDAEELTEEEQLIRDEMMHEWSLDDNTPYPPRIELDDADLMLEMFLLREESKASKSDPTDDDKMMVNDIGDDDNDDLDDQNSGNNAGEAEKLSSP